MGGRDITQWVVSSAIRQPQNALYIEWEVVTKGWHNFQAGERWDIYASYSADSPRAELLVRQGVVPADRQPEITWAVDQAPTLKITGYDSVWLSQRRSPRQTAVFVGAAIEAQRALGRHSGPIGKYAIHTVRGMRMADVLRRLGTLAGFGVECRIPNQRLMPFVMHPTASYWQQISTLVAPWAPFIYYRAETNTLVIIDPMSAQSPTGSVLTLSEYAVAEMRGLPARHRSVSRVLIKVAS